ncbi:hypothetical protein [Actinomadura sp. 21ATH]|uniref:hypothetical protein n=1 Tax=Actinomadura sp. 21ATH TaxID=1735444 RepID=UPI0035BF7A3B
MSPGGELEVERDQLKQAGGGFKDGGQALRAVGTKLDGILSGEGKCWGADETGKAFEQDYLKNAEDVLKMIEQVAENIVQMKQGIDEMAGTVGDAEDATGGA